MKKNYELMFIIDPQTTEEERKEVVAKVNSILEVVEAGEVKVDEWGERKLAYPINKKSTGYYVLVKFVCAGPNLAEMERRLNIQEQIMRYIVVNKD